LAKGPENIGDPVAYVVRRKYLGGLPDRLKDQGNRPFVGVRIRNGEGNALTEVVVELHNDELSRVSLARNILGTNPQAEYLLGQLLAIENLMHRRFPSQQSGSEWSS
jgi:hypothetical protein